MSETSKRRPFLPPGIRSYRGSCHCGTVQFEAQFDLSKGATKCNCTICQRLGAAKAAMKPEAFRLVQGADQLHEYRIGDSPNARYFCKRCGIYLYGAGYVEEIGGAFVSVNVYCLEDVEVSDVPVSYWDGRHDNWQAGLRDTPWPVLTKLETPRAQLG